MENKMNNCCKLLHAYELDILSEQEAAEFEEHLLTCSDCYDKLSRFYTGMNIIKNEIDIKKIAGQSNSTITQQTKKPVISYLFNKAVLVAMICLLIIPALIGIKSFFTEDLVRPVNSISLFSSRSTADTNIIDGNLDIALTILCHDIDLSQKYIIQILDENSVEIYRLNDYTNFNEDFITEILIPSGILDDGSYKLKVLNSDETEVQSFNFKIQEREKSK